MAKQTFVHLLRHGQFAKDPGINDGMLTSLGRRQARHVANRLDERHVARVYSSDLIRAQETAEIILRRLPVRTVTALPLLREMVPTRVPGVHVPLVSRRAGREKLELIMRRFFSRRNRSGDTVIVCHGNLIRALLCRILAAPLTKWPDLGIYHCGITSFNVVKGGRVRLVCFNDSGHLPGNLRTIS